jgi:hypothetical protein
MNLQLKNSIRYIAALLLFTVVSLAYFSPVLEGKKLYQNDIKHFTGMAKEINDFRDQTQSEPYWTNAAFSGMPTYNLSAYYPNDFIKKVDSWFRFLPRPADYLFLYFVCFFILLAVLRVDFRLAILGALAFGFSTYLIIILGVGHNAKAHAIAYMPLVLAGILLVFRSNYLWGFVLTTIAMALEINTSHPQMTYYLLFAILIMGIVWLVDAYRKKTTKTFLKGVLIVGIAFVLAVGTNATRLMATKEYAAYSTRGKSELTIKPDGSPNEVTTGLDKYYITEYSYGTLETLNLFIPRFMGGGNFEDVGQESNIYEFLQNKVDPGQARQFVQGAPTYWGDQPIVEAPAYVGAIMIFLFVLGIFLVKGKLRNWLLGIVLFSILLSWGKNFGLLTDLFIDYMPLYNKFRAVSSIQVMAELAIPVLAILALDRYLSDDLESKTKTKYLKKALYITGGIGLFFALFGTGLFAFEGLRDATYDGMLPGLLDAIIADRKAMLLDDSLRTLGLVLGAGIVLWIYAKGKLSKNLTIGFVALLAIFDLVSIDLNYVNKNDFLNKRTIDKPFVASAIDNQILEDTGHYRVANFLVDPMNDGSTSYFHNSIGGYFAAKMGRYQDLFDFHIARNNIEVLNMLNIKYFIFPDGNQRPMVQINPDANGNAWFIEDLMAVESADEEIKALDSLLTKKEAVIRANYMEDLKSSYAIDSTATIALKTVSPVQLTYEYKSGNKAFAVFSEIYYPKGWEVYINGEKQNYYPVNYVLRGMELPAGSNTVEFRFEPQVIKKGNRVTLISYFLLLFIPAGWFLLSKRKNNVS